MKLEGISFVSNKLVRGMHARVKRLHGVRTLVGTMAMMQWRQHGCVVMGGGGGCVIQGIRDVMCKQLQK